MLVAERYFFLAGVAFVIGSICDTLDGRYSRMSGKGTPFGAFLDSTLDRIEEGIVLTTVAAYFASRNMQFAVGACVVAVLGSPMVGYTRARAEALGVECKVGIADAGGPGRDPRHWHPVRGPRPPRPRGRRVSRASGPITVLERILHVRKELKAAASTAADL